MMKRLMCVMVVGIFVMTGGLFVSGAMAAKTVVVAVQAPITGPWAFEGQMAVQSCKVAAELINQKGGILGEMETGMFTVNFSMIREHLRTVPLPR